MLTLMVISNTLMIGAMEITTGPVETVAEGFEFTEGPIWIPDKGLIFSDIPADIIYKSDKSVFRKPSGQSNGLTLDKQGRLIACEHWNRRVSRTEKDGTIKVIADYYEGKKLNSPNDVVVRSDGTVFFTDPPYGLEGREAELPYSGVYAILPDGKIILLDKSFRAPNGLAFSPDEKLLYIGDSKEGFIRVHNVAKDGILNNGKLFCEVPGPDGMKVDIQGNLWTTARDGVRIYKPDGTLISTIEFPQRPANCAFGDADYKTLYVTAREGVYKVRCSVEGVR